MKHKFKKLLTGLLTVGLLCGGMFTNTVRADSVSLGTVYYTSQITGTGKKVVQSVTLVASATPTTWTDYYYYDDGRTVYSYENISHPSTSTTSLIGYTSTGTSRTLKAVTNSSATYVFTASDLATYNRFMVTNTGSVGNNNGYNPSGWEWRSYHPAYSENYRAGSYSGSATASYTTTPFIEIGSYGATGVYKIPKEAIQLSVGVAQASTTVTCAYCGHSNGYIGTVRSTNWVKLLDENDGVLATFNSSTSSRVNLSSYPAAKKVQLYSAPGAWGSWTCTDYVERWGHDCNNTNSGGATGTGSCSVTFYGLERPTNPEFGYGNLTILH